MQQNYPHEIRRFKDGDPIPEGFTPLTEAEAEELEPMSADDRRRWLKSREEAFFQTREVHEYDPTPHGSPRSSRPRKGLEAKGGSRRRQAKRKPKRKGGRR